MGLHDKRSNAVSRTLSRRCPSSPKPDGDWARSIKATAPGYTITASLCEPRMLFTYDSRGAGRTASASRDRTQEIR
jgi:hypothetical protein